MSDPIAWTAYVMIAAGVVILALLWAPI